MPKLLELVNEVLLLVGEHPAIDLTTPVALKAKLAYQLSLQFCSTLHGWMFLRQTVSTTNWVNGVATIVPFQKIYSVSSGSSILSPQRLEVVRRLTVQSPFTGNPSYYSICGDNQLLVYPIPPVAQQSLVMFNILANITIPQQAEDVILYPQSFLNLVSLYAQVTMHRVHTTDMVSMESSMRAFELATHMLRTREDDTPGNMYP